MTTFIHILMCILIAFIPLTIFILTTKKSYENSYEYIFKTTIYGEDKMNSLVIMERIEKNVMDLQFSDHHKSKILERIRLEIEYAKYAVIKELGQKAYEELKNKEKE